MFFFKHNEEKLSCQDKIKQCFLFIHFVPDHSKGFMKDGKIQSLGFKSIYALSKNVPIKSEEKHFDNAFLVLRGITRLASFFGESYTFRDGKSIRENETAIFLGALLLRLSKIIQLNSHDVSKISFADA